MLEETFSDIKFENKTSFEILVINGPNNVEQFNYNDIGYVNKLLDQDYVKIVNANSENFLEIITDNLCIEDFNELDRNVDTHVIYEKSGYVYEIMHLYAQHKDTKTNKYFNHFGSMLRRNVEPIFGNVIILKSHLPNDSNSMNLVNMGKMDLFEILDTRVNTKVVIYQNDEFRDDVIKGDIEECSQQIFEGDYFKRIEIKFLLHNINIFYVANEYGEDIAPKLIPEKVETALFFTKIDDEFRGNLTLDEVKKIIELSNKLESFEVDEEYMKEEKDDLGRNIIKNKYKILEFVYNKYK